MLSGSLLDPNCTKPGVSSRSRLGHSGFCTYTTSILSLITPRRVLQYSKIRTFKKGKGQ
jgi:hypothetical protein